MLLSLPSAVSDSVRRGEEWAGDHWATAGTFVDQLGHAAFAVAVDHHFQASLARDDDAVEFWDRVCAAIVRLRTGAGRGPLAPGRIKQIGRF